MNAAALVALSVALVGIGLVVAVAGSHEPDLNDRLPRIALGVAIILFVAVTLAAYISKDATLWVSGTKPGIAVFLYASMLWTAASELRFNRELRRDIEHAVTVASELIERGQAPWTGKASSD